MKLYLARHAETNYNLQKLANADPSVDVHLSENGIQQAENLAELLKDVPYEIVFISELPRTRETAEIINKYHNKEMVVDGRINDNKTGYESKPVIEWLDALDVSGDFWNAKFNGGESLNEAAARAQEFIEHVKTLGHKAVLVVTHGFMTQAIFGHIENKPIDEAFQFNLPQGTYAEFDI
ncbi:MAG TPA: histidine phosphatase family protein [Candidatus Saccharibacteria bacterium]|nr:histidine phosphatase family protein [Candidatus Saccharibacteria bacterium]